MCIVDKNRKGGGLESGLFYADIFNGRALRVFMHFHVIILGKLFLHTKASLLLCCIVWYFVEIMWKSLEVFLVLSDPLDFLHIPY